MTARYGESPAGICRTSDFEVGECIRINGCPRHSSLQLTHAVEPAPDDRCADCGDRPAGDYPGLWWQLGDEAIAPRVCGACADERRGETKPTPLSNEAYHQLPSLSASGAKILLQDGGPAKYRWEMDHRDQRAPKDAWDEGHAVHHFVLGSDPAPIAVEANDWKTNAAKNKRAEIRANGGVPLLRKKYDECRLIADHVLANDDVQTLLARGGTAEDALFWMDPDAGIPLRARPDWHSHDWTVVLDLKTTANASATAFAKSVWDFCYDVQENVYRAGVRELHGVDPAFVFVCVETTPPYLVQCHELGDEYAKLGYERFRRAVELWRQCTENGSWPGYPTGFASKLSPPKWATYAWENTA